MNAYSTLGQMYDTLLVPLHMTDTCVQVSFSVPMSLKWSHIKKE